MSFSYSSINGYRQIVTRNINAPLLGTFDKLNLNNAIYPLGDSQAVFKIFSEGRSELSRINIGFDAERIPYIKKEIGFGFDYSYTRGKDNIVYGSSNINPYDFSNEYAPSTLDGVHTLRGGLSTVLPKSINLDLYFVYRSGLRFNITTGEDLNGDGYYDERPGFASDLNKPAIVFTKYGVFDPNSSSNVIPRNLGRGPNFMEFNLILTKSFKLFVDEKSKKAKARLRINAHVNNLFNTNNLGNPIGNISSPNFLRSINSGSLEGTGRFSEPRSIDFVATFSF